MGHSKGWRYAREGSLAEAEAQDLRVMGDMREASYKIPIEFESHLVYCV